MSRGRVAELIAQRQFRQVENEVGDPGPGEAQVRVESVGICGSDLHSYAEGRIGDSVCTYPMVLGHEPAGVVVKTGPGVTGWSPGDRAAFEPSIYCYHCEYCMSGRHNVCEKLRFMSSPGDPGYFCDYINLPVTNLLATPGLDANQASLVEPLAIALHSLKIGQPKIGETAVVFGAGPI